jgi:hypothetical protein
MSPRQKRPRYTGFRKGYDCWKLKIESQACLERLGVRDLDPRTAVDLARDVTVVSSLGLWTGIVYQTGVGAG